MLFRFEYVVTGLSVPRSARREAGLCSGEREHRPKVDGLPVPFVELSSGTCRQIGNLAMGQVSSITCSATDKNGKQYELRIRWLAHHIAQGSSLGPKHPAAWVVAPSNPPQGVIALEGSRESRSDPSFVGMV